ncbi:MAG: hypothetical protein NTW87_34920 [Planctomycetota bacterium]|nr:hypothetical protein [Planctomycetota bacterium]
MRLTWILMIVSVGLAVEAPRAEEVVWTPDRRLVTSSQKTEDPLYRRVSVGGTQVAYPAQEEARVKELLVEYTEVAARMGAAANRKIALEVADEPISLVVEIVNGLTKINMTLKPFPEMAKRRISMQVEGTAGPTLFCLCLVGNLSLSFDARGPVGQLVLKDRSDKDAASSSTVAPVLRKDPIVPPKQAVGGSEKGGDDTKP